MYAQFSANSYNLTINPNGGTYNGTTGNTTHTQEYGTSKVIPDATRNGYKFNGWDISGAYSGMYDNTVYTLTGTNYYTISDSYEYTDKITVSVWAYHDSWTSSSEQRIINCTNSGGWSIELVDTNKVRFGMMTSNMSGYHLQLHKPMTLERMQPLRKKQKAIHTLLLVANVVGLQTVVIVMEITLLVKLLRY